VNEHDQQPIREDDTMDAVTSPDREGHMMDAVTSPDREGDTMDAVTSPEERGMAYLWQAVTEQITDHEAMRVHVIMARALLGDGRTCTRLLK
jgi:hypothetical protein